MDFFSNYPKVVINVESSISFQITISFLFLHRMMTDVMLYQVHLQQKQVTDTEVQFTTSRL